MSVANTVQPRCSVLPPTGVGLANLGERCQLLAGRPLTRSRLGDRFAIDAFRALAVDYLLKPVAGAALARAPQKVESATATEPTSSST